MRDIYSGVAGEICSRVVSGKMLDVGTGPGLLPILVAKRSPAVKVVGIDVSEDMIGIAKKNAEKENLTDRVDFYVEDVSEMSFEDSSFDFIFSTLSIHHWEEPVKAVNEINRVLKNGGEAWIYDFRKDVTKEVNWELRDRYGWFLGSLVIRVIRFHSSITLQRVNRILSDSETRFKDYDVRDKGAILRISLRKTLVDKT